MVVGISIIESSLGAPVPNLTYFDRTYLFGFAAGAASTDLNTPIQVADATAFSARFSGASAITLASVKLFFKNFTDGNLYFITSKDPAITDAADKGHFIYAANVIKQRTDLELGTIICPDQGEFAQQADRTAVYSALNALAEKLDWLNLVNTATVTDTPAEAKVERALYTSTNGHSAIYLSNDLDADSQRVPITPIVAAIAQKRSKEDTPYSPPGGADYPITGLKEPIFLVNETDYLDLQTHNINVLQRIPRIGVCIWGARTLSTNEKFLQINSRVANSLVTRDLTIAFTPFLFDAIDPQGATKRQIIMAGFSVLQTAYINGGLSGDSPEEAFRIEEISSVTENLRKVQIRMYARFVDTLEQIEVALINVTNLPV
jgi:hypothetical protein